MITSETLRREMSPVVVSTNDNLHMLWPRLGGTVKPRIEHLRRRKKTGDTSTYRHSRSSFFGVCLGAWGLCLGIRFRCPRRKVVASCGWRHDLITRKLALLASESICGRSPMKEKNSGKMGLQCEFSTKINMPSESPPATRHPTPRRTATKSAPRPFPWDLGPRQSPERCVACLLSRSITGSCPSPFYILKPAHHHHKIIFIHPSTLEQRRLYTLQKNDIISNPRYCCGTPDATP